MRRLIAFGIIFLLVLAIGSQGALAQKIKEVSRSAVPTEDLFVGEKVHIDVVVLKEVSSDLTDRTTLNLSTSLIDPIWDIKMENASSWAYQDTKRNWEFNLEFDHSVYDTLTIGLSGTAPEVGKKEYYHLMQISIGDEAITEISAYVTTDEINKVLASIDRAEERIMIAKDDIKSAEDAGVPAAMLEASKGFLNSAEGSWGRAKVLYEVPDMGASKQAAEDSYGEATRASDSARAAIETYEGQLESNTLIKYGIIAGILILLLIVLVITLKKKAWDRLG
ncbi:MAG: hypothetical protein PHS47_03065 [Methanocellales archaeon]|nr:hypothetical protein [Methanocellales archaeon]MDD3421263.1 hypothetical protein [Methanocellales archaeon]MDD4898415.1 hypothetical protein [Methanocellales archaeon]MDD5446856.1 hypothetical protein [Methanocellales archaeon]